MSREHRIENVRITAAERRNNSTSGNPTWRLFTDQGTFTTEPDAQIGYSIANLSNSRLDTYAIGDDAPPVTLLVRGYERVYGIERSA